MRKSSTSDSEPSVGFFHTLVAVFIVAVLGAAVGRKIEEVISRRPLEISPGALTRVRSSELQPTENARMTYDAFSVEGKRRRIWVGFVLTLVAILSFYFWNMHSSNSDLFNEDGGRYGDVANAFLHGQVSLLIQPDPKLLSAPDPYDPHADRGDILWDGSYYKGKYYSDREVTPTLFLFLPYQLITGHIMNQALAFYMICVVNVLLFTALLLLMVHFRFPHVPLFWQLTLLVVYSFSNLALYHLRRGWMYEMDEMSGATALLALFIALFLLLQLPRQRTWWMLATGLVYGLVAATRPNYILAGASPFFVWLYLFQSRKREGISWTKFAGQTAIMVAPAFLIGLGIAWYNYARFQSPFDFGQSHCLNSYDFSGPMFNLRYFPDRFWEDLFMPPLFSHQFPFVIPGARLIPGLFADRLVWGPVCSIFACAPICWFALLARREIIRFPNQPDLQGLRIFVFSVFAAWVMVSIPVLIYFSIDIRHIIDIGTPLLVLASLSILARRERAKFSGTYLLLLLPAMAISLYVGFAFGLIGTFNWIGVEAG